MLKCSCRHVLHALGLTAVISQSTPISALCLNGARVCSRMKNQQVKQTIVPWHVCVVTYLAFTLTMHCLTGPLTICCCQSCAHPMQLPHIHTRTKRYMREKRQHRVSCSKPDSPSVAIKCTHWFGKANGHVSLLPDPS